MKDKQDKANDAWAPPSDMDSDAGDMEDPFGDDLFGADYGTEAPAPAKKPDPKPEPKGKGKAKGKGKGKEKAKPKEEPKEEEVDMDDLFGSEDEETKAVSKNDEI